MADEQMTLEQFGQKVKAKYPEYANLSDTDIANKVIAKYPQYKSVILPSSGPTGEIRPIPQRERFLNPDLYPVGEKGEGLGENLHNLAQRTGVGVFQLADALANPRRTLAGLEASILPEPAVKAVNSVVDLENRIPGISFLTTKLPEGTENPLETAYSAVVTSRNPTEVAGHLAPVAGQVLAGNVAGELVGPVTEGLRSTAEKARAAKTKIVEGATDTSPRVTRDLVKRTQAENDAERERVSEKNAAEAEKARQGNLAQEEKRKQQIKKHGEQKISADKAREEVQNHKDRKTAIEHGVERLDTEVRGDLEKAEEKVHSEANKKYNDLRAVLKDEVADPYQPIDEEGHVQGEPVSMVEHLYDVASQPLRGTETEPSIIKSLAKRTEQGDVDITYNDLQGYREEVGRELRKGTLAPDVYTSYKNLIAAIDDAMGRIAERNGLKDQQDSARAYYRQYAETFLDLDAVARKALDSKERGGVAKAYQGKDQSGIEQIARFDPQTAQRLNNLRGYQAEAKAIRPSTAKPKEVSPLPPKPTPVEPKVSVPEISKIDAEDIRAAKAGNLQKRAELIRRYSARAAFYVTGYRSLVAIGRAVMGDTAALSGLPVDIGEGLAVAAGGSAFANFLESPKVVKLLTEPTERDLAEIPADLRGDLKPIVEAAQKQGIKVDPRVSSLVGVTAILQGPKTQQLRDTVERYRANAYQ